MEDRPKIVSVFLNHVTSVFTLTIIASSIAARFLRNIPEEYAETFTLGSESLSYDIIMQFFVFSILVSCLSVILTTDILFKKTMLLWRYVLQLFLIFMTCGLFAAIFRWFPLNNWMAWTVLFTTLGVVFIAGAFPMIIKTKLEDRRYEKLLSDYKLRQNANREELK